MDPERFKIGANRLTTKHWCGVSTAWLILVQEIGGENQRVTDESIRRRSTEISLVIRQTMEECILTNLMPRSQIDIYVQVLQADGGTRSACINAATLALADAGIPMRDLVTSCSAGFLNSTPLLDLNYVEDSAGGPDVTVGILPKLDKVTLLQMDAKLPIDTFENVMQLAVEGCKAIANYIREVLLENTKQLEYRRGL
ncbi:exosome complex component RRP41 homolog isoform X2 [Populus alba]|uniref:exosome complex component RRP41 homolog isoform X2 n=1 Tax=Populus alba TaxID=43335 RepID=UPI001589EEDF|nr:exosome complex component RRP41 homolog isoform X2 [Populus alba]